MKCQTLFSGENRQNTIHLFSAEVAQRVVKVQSKKPQKSFVNSHV